MGKKLLNACEWWSNVEKSSRSVTNAPQQLEKQIQCRLLFMGNCSTEWKRFYALQLWAVDFYDLKWSGDGHSNSLVAFLDRMIARASLYQPAQTYELMVALLMQRRHSERHNVSGDELNVRTFRNSTLVYSIDHDNLLTQNKSHIDMTCFNSTRLRIDCNWQQQQPAGRYKLGWVNFTFWVNVSSGGKRRHASILPVRLNISLESWGLFEWHRFFNG